MTPRGKEFVAKMIAATDLVDKSGKTPFVALSCSLEDDDWILVFAAATKMANDIIEQHRRSPQVTVPDHD